MLFYSNVTNGLKRLIPFRIAAILVLILATVLFVVRCYTLVTDWNLFFDALSETTVYAMAFLIVLFAVKSILWFIPLKLIYLTAGFLLPATQAIIIVYLGLALELSIGFYIGRKSNLVRIRPIMNKYKVSRWIVASAERHGSLGCFSVRFLPTPPAEVTNIFFGSIDIRYIEYLFASLLGLTPAMIPVVFVGRSAADPLSRDFIIPFSISLVIVILSMMIAGFIKKRHQDQDSLLAADSISEKPEQREKAKHKTDADKKASAYLK